MADPASADFILAHGTEALGTPDGSEPQPLELDEIQELLQQCADRKGVPMLVANPDIMTVSGRSLLAMPGKLGQWYKGMGGEVSNCSFHACCKLLNRPVKLWAVKLCKADGWEADVTLSAEAICLSFTLMRHDRW